MGWKNETRSPDHRQCFSPLCLLDYSSRMPPLKYPWSTVCWRPFDKPSTCDRGIGCICRYTWRGRYPTLAAPLSGRQKQSRRQAPFTTQSIQLSCAAQLSCFQRPVSLVVQMQGERRPRPEAVHGGVRDNSKGSKQNDKSNADGTVSIVLTFVVCVLVAVVGFA